MKTKMIVVALGLLMYQAPSFACMRTSAPNNRVSDDSVRQYLREVSYLSASAEVNRTIETCFNKNVNNLSWKQVKMLVSGLQSWAYYSTDTNNSGPTRGRMADRFLSTHIREIDADLAAEIAKYRYSQGEANASIESYFNQRIQDLSLRDLYTLTNGLQSWAYYSTDTNNKGPTQARMAEKFAKTYSSRLNVNEAVSLAQHMANQADQNRVIEEFFNANAKRLSWNDLQDLIAGLASWAYYSTDHYNKAPTTDRMIRTWNDCQ